MEIPIYKYTVARFASIAEGRKLLGTLDDYVKMLTPLDMKLRMKTNQKMSKEAFLSFAANQAVEWCQDEIDDIAQALVIVRQKIELSGIDIDLPEHILLIKTTGREDAGTYTRGNGIIIPNLGSQQPSVDRLSDGILHELFHVMTRYKPQIREQLYNIIGFHPCDEVALPDSLSDWKITNPDAPSSSFFIEVSVKGVPTKVIPIIYSKNQRYNGSELSDYLIFKLMAVEIVNGVCQPALDRGTPILYDVSEVTNFYEQIGHNTEYIIHPEEILACNFVHMVNQNSKAPNPEILDSVKEILSK